MNLNSVRTGLVALAFGVAANGFLVSGAHAEEYSFTATNTTNPAITELLVSDNKSDWVYFDIGNGIKPGETVNLVWSQSTNDEACEQWVKATFADGSESEPAKFDFCEDGLELDL